MPPPTVALYVSLYKALNIIYHVPKVYYSLQPISKKWYFYILEILLIHYILHSLVFAMCYHFPYIDE